jgi:iron complex transport system ATP-binding protein
MTAPALSPDRLGSTSPGADADIVFSADAIDLIRDGKLLLDQVGITVRAGEHWALLGANRAGKSTLLQIMATLSFPSRGVVEVLGHQLGTVDVFTLRPLIGHVSAHHRLEPYRRLSDVVLTGVTGTIQLVQGRATSADEVGRAAAAIELMGLAGRPDAAWETLSQGERARGLIARALAGQPRLLLLDEPAAGLDVAGREQLLARLDHLRRERPELASVLVTHHLEELPASTTHGLLLRAGRVLAAGPVDDVLTSELASECFGYPVTVSRHAGRWAVTASPAAT